MINFGLWSTTLLVGSVHGIVVSALLLRSDRNRLANRFLAVFLVAVVLLITPFTIGYAGLYNAYPWLSFAPFFWQLGFGPLLFFYVRQLGNPSLPPRWPLHFIPAVVQGSYYTVAFCLPLAQKDAWNDSVHVHWILPIQSILSTVSFVYYWLASLRVYRIQQAWLESHRGDREEFRTPWIRNFLWAVLIAGVADTVVRVSDAIWPLSYRDVFGLYLGFTVLVYYLGIEGWRHANLPFPNWQSSDNAPEETAAPTELFEQDTAALIAPVDDEAKRGFDWKTLGERWARQVEQAQWWRQSDLTLARLASKLGTNTSYLSRALNEGLNQTFSECINRMRVHEAQRLLLGTSEILEIALEVGFGSKASFNRAFRAYSGVTPSQFRDKNRAAVSFSK